MAAASSDSSCNRSWKYDVFLSFRGPDTRKIFVGHLHQALERKSLIAFIDTEELKKGEVLQVLLKAIDDSKISVVIFSQNYASSRWCLKELVQIMECMDTKQQVVVPIFYQVDPAHVRYQKESFDEAFAKYEHDGRESMEELQRWRSALARAAQISGWDSSEYKDDAKLIECVVEDIFEKWIKMRSSEIESKDLVGMNYHIQRMEGLLLLKNDVPRTVRIWGMGGLGKTTIARAVYDKFSSSFGASCFLENVRQNFRAKSEGQMQEELLYRILRERVRNLGTSNMASEMIREMLSKKKLFIVLDDVDNLAQVEALLGKNPSFSPGSRIIITTRDKHLLSESVIYHPSLLRSDEALQLFQLYAKSSKQHNHLSSRALNYAQGLPLAIKVLGASLHGKSVSEWEDEFEKIKKVQHRGIQAVLRISYEGLDDLEKKIFLDVACFFIGITEDYATLILHACGLHPVSGLIVLADRALVTTSGYHSPVLGMHDLLQDMALEIVRQQSTPSRLTNFDDIEDMLTQYTVEELKAVESIDLDLYTSKNVDINIGAFNSMKKLRLLRIHYNRSIDSVDDYDRSSEELYHPSAECKQNVSGDLQFLSNELRCLIWHGCPLKSLPTDFRPKHLIDLDMRCSAITQLWEGVKVQSRLHYFRKLKFINLSRSLYLREIPDLTEAKNLEKVHLEGCISLLEVHSSISDLENLVYLNLKGCKELKILPRSIRMKCLKTLELSGCSNLGDFPEISEVMGKLPRLCLDMTAIKTLPFSIKNLTGLVTLSLKNCRELESLPSSICQLQSLRYVTLSGCSKFESFPNIAGAKDMERLRELHLDGTSIKEFTPSILALQSLDVLSLRDCKELKSLSSSMYMGNLNSLHLSGCSKLKMFPQISKSMIYLSELNLDDIAIEELPQSIAMLRHLNSLILRDCGEIRTLPGSIFQIPFLKEITVSGCSKFEKFPEISVVECHGLDTLRLEDCGELRNLPSSLSLLKFLKFVTLSGCSKFEVFPEISTEMEYIQELHLDATSIAKLFSSIDWLKRLMLLNLTNCRRLTFLPDSICNLSYLTGLTLSGCSNLSNLPENLERLELLRDLEIEGSGIKQPFSPLRVMRSPSSSTNCLVGMDRHIDQIQKLLSPLQVDAVHIVGICGMCGIGKTTVARALYDKIAPQFEHHCFLENVKEGFMNHGAVHMQEEFLSRMRLKQKVQSSSILNRAAMIREMLSTRKVLAVLDDVDDISQIETLLGQPHSLGDGSRIIVTTRSDKILSGYPIYFPQFTDEDAIKLLKQYAFRSTEPSEQYDLLLQQAIKCTQGHPLALKVLGSYLFGKSTYWWEAPSRIDYDVYTSSFDSLGDSEKNIFLDVASFFKGMRQDYVEEILHSCGFFPYSGLRILLDRSLITISHWDGTVKMYDVIYQVGYEAARQESEHGPGERKRLWGYDGIQCLSTGNMVINRVEAINVDFSKSKEVYLDAQAFVKMKKLRLLRILDENSIGRKQHVSENFEFLSHELRCLIWHNFPLRSLPPNFHPKNLVELDMRGSHIEQLCEGTKLLKNLKFINLSHCPYLKETPDLTEATNLKKLCLEGCTSLVMVHPSILDRKSVVLLNLKGCRELKFLPSSIHMKSLKTLNLSCCSNLEKFPDVSEIMMELSEIDLDETAITVLPSSIQLLQGLNVLSMRKCRSLISLPDSICKLQNLQQLNLDGCSKLSKYPKTLRSSQSLTISGIEQLPFFIKDKETERKGVIGASGEGNSSELGEGRLDKHALCQVPEPQIERKEDEDMMEAEVHGEEGSGRGVLGTLCRCWSFLGALYHRER